MMDFTFENQGTFTYLVYKFSPEDEIDSMSLGMLTNNRIDGLASASFFQADAAKYLKYDVTSRVSVKKFFDGPVNRKRLLGVFRGIVNGLLAAEDYMIEPGCILLEPEYIFADVTSCDTVLVCLPVVRPEAAAPDPGAFFRSIMFGAQFDQTENSEHVVQIMNYLNSAPSFSLTGFRQVLDKLMAAPAPAASAPAAPAVSAPPAAAMPAAGAQRVQPSVPAPAAPKRGEWSTPASAAPAQKTAPSRPAQPKAAKGEEMSLIYLLRHYSKENAAIYKAQQEAKKQEAAADEAASSRAAAEPEEISFAIPGQKSSLNINENSPVETLPELPELRQQSAGRRVSFGETTVLAEETGSETTVLTGAVAAREEQKLRPQLVRARNRETVSITKSPFRIGKERSYVDYFIGDNAAISRSHATITQKDGVFYIEDENSKNHTYVNGTMIQSGCPTALDHGAAIMLANESFEFRLY